MKQVLSGIMVFSILCSLPTFAIADDGIYTQTVTDGNWSNVMNWSSEIVANGSGSTANFSTIEITATNRVRLDNGGATRTIGNLIFGDLTATHGWIIYNIGNAANTLTLAGSTPTITVNDLGAGVVTMSATLLGAGSVTKAGVGTLTLNNSVDIAGDFIVSGGTVNAPNADFAVGGDCDLDGGTFNAGTDVDCIVILDGASTQDLTSGGTSFHDLRHSGSGTCTLQDPLTISRNLTNNGGTFNCNDKAVVIKDFNNSGIFIAPTSATFSISGGCDLRNGTFTAGTGKVVLNGALQDIWSDGETFFDLEHSGTGTVTLKDALSVSRNLTNNGGTFNCNDKAVVIKDFNNTSGIFIAPTSATFSISGGCDLEDGTFMAGTGTVTFNGNGDLTTASKNFNNVKIAGSVDLHPDPLIIDGTLELSGSANLNTNDNAVTVTGLTTIQAGTYTAGAGGHAFDGGLTFLGGTINGTGTITGPNYNLTDSGTISAILAGAGSTLTKTGAGTATLSGANTYTGLTTITAGTLKVENSSALGTGAGNVVNNATLDIGSTNLNIGAGDYTQGAGAMLKAAINGTSNGKIITTGNCTINAGDDLVLDITNFIPNNTAYTIIDGGGAGGIAAPDITVNGNDHVTFSVTTVGTDLIIVASRVANSYAKEAADSNASAAGNALEAAGNTGATGDMLTVLNALESLSNTQASAALDTVIPDVSAGVIDTSSTILNNFVGVAMERVENVLRLASNSRDVSTTGISAGDGETLNGIWAKGYGSYLNQDLRKDIQGYHAWNAGTALGVDRLFTNNITLGISGGYAYGNVDSDANNGNTYINSGQGTIYGGYQNETYPFFIDAAGSFAWNWYNGRRDITVGTINRTANAEYDGQQYSAYIGGGYRFDAGHNLFLTPLVSLNYVHLHLASYTETEAGALNLRAASQDYDFLQSGVGGRIEYPVNLKYGLLTPEVHGKWLYDFIGDDIQATSTFTGGGASFNTNGCPPAQSSFDVGGKLSLALKNDVTITGECDTELKDKFWGIYGSVTLRYNF